MLHGSDHLDRRVALAGYHAVAPDFLSSLGGTPPDENTARDLIGKLDLAQATADGVATLAELKRRRAGNGKAGAVGFCWGGAMVNRLAVNAGNTLDAGVPYYGTAPAPAEAAKVRAPLLIHLASLDARVNATALPWGEALRAVDWTEGDVLVIGASSSPVSRFLLGSHASKIVRHAPVPVTLVPRNVE